MRLNSIQLWLAGVIVPIFACFATVCCFPDLISEVDKDGAELYYFACVK